MQRKSYVKIIAMLVLFIGISLFIVGCNFTDDKADKEKKYSDETPFQDLDSNGEISVGDKVTLESESFYVISTNKEEDTVKMLAEWNLNVGMNTVEGTEGIQNETCIGWWKGASIELRKCTIAFADTNYWIKSVTSYPKWVYNEQSNLYKYVEDYATYLKEKGYSSVSASLISPEELVALGCSGEVESDACENAPSWVKNTSYWTGSTGRFPSLASHVNTEGSYGGTDCGNSVYYGIRPVITIAKNELDIK